ncbi:MAG: AMP-binding protein [Planctomycetes bacterium]|nr:AMP-binding protein [Planctomycetota bacterium]
MTILDRLHRSCARFAQKTALSFDERHPTFADLDGGSNAAARVLSAFGVKRGDRVALYASNSLEFVLAYLGTLKLGAIALPINPAYRDAELAHILGDATPRLVVADRDGLGRVDAVAPDAVVAVLEIERGEVERPTTHRPVHAFMSALRKTGMGPLAVTVEREDDALLVYTSGTTGKPKGALLTHANLIDNALALIDAFGWTEHDRLVHALPLFHVHGLCVALHGALVTGSEVLLESRFDAARILEHLARFEATLFMGVPTMFSRLADVATAVRLPDLRLCICGSAPLQDAVAERFARRFGIEPLQRYGMTETLITFSQRHDRPRIRGHVGFPVAGIEARIVDATNTPVADGAVGELQVRGTSVGRGYWNDEAATRAAFVDGWFKTGDLARRDAHGGETALVGRARELVISGGLNVYPAEVEQAIAHHPDVAEVAVFGVPDPDFGESVAAAVVLREGATLTSAALDAFLVERIASFKKPKVWRVVRALPKNAMGKVQKDVLRDHA